MKRVIELIRVSTAQQAAEDRASIPAQRSVNLRTAHQHGLEIVQSIEYCDVSGASVLYAPEMRELLGLINDPDIHGVVTKEFSRLMRPENFADYAILQAFIDTRTVLYLPDGAIDFTTKGGLMLGTLRAVMAGMEISDIKERGWDAKEANRKAGGFSQSRICLPFGVGYDKEKGWHYLPEVERVTEAVRLFLGGETSYVSVGRKVNIEPFNLRLILRNPIYTGWRVIDKRRDPSPSARKVKVGGRQGDRRKINRAPEDVIRIKVIDEPIVSEEEFARLQSALEVKRVRHWRTRSDYEHRFTYNGFLTCSACGQIVYSKFRRRDYYVCKGRYMLHLCDAQYMRREAIEPRLDEMFGKVLTNRTFLRRIFEQARKKAGGVERESRTERLYAEIEKLEARRERVKELYIDGVIDAGERNHKLTQIESNVRATRAALSREPVSNLSLDVLLSTFGVFHDWLSLKRHHKRRILTQLQADIKLANYAATCLGVNLPLPFGNEINHTGKDYLMAAPRIILPLDFQLRI